MVIRTSNRFSLALALTCCAITFGGCAVIGHKEMPLLDPEPVAGPSAKIAIWRVKQFCGSYPLHYVVVDERPIVALATGQHTAFDLSPGRHSLGVYHHVIDMPLLVGGGRAALPVGVHYGRYGALITEDFLAGQSYRYLLRSKCFPFDENERVVIEKLEKWPEDLPLDSQQFVRPGIAGANQSAP